MSSTKSPSHAEQATDVPLLIVSHGSPSDPDPQEEFLSDLAARIAEVSGRTVVSATLAKEGAMAAAVAGFDNAPEVFAHFMSDGWFVSTNLPKRLAQAGLTDYAMAPALGLLDALPDLALDVLRAQITADGLPEGGTTLIVAAHGSPSDPRPAKATQRFADKLAASGLFCEVRTGYVDEDPSLEDAARVTGPAIVLPFFAARAGHVLMDLPDALTAANFKGAVLDPIGTWPQIPELIAVSLGTQQSQSAA